MAVATRVTTMNATILTTQSWARVTTLNATTLISIVQCRVTQLNTTVFHTLRHQDTRVTQICGTILTFIQATIGRRTHRLPPKEGIAVNTTKPQAKVKL